MRQRALYGIAGILLLVAGVALMTRAQAQEPERWLHVRVENTGEKAELVRVNLPLSLAEKVLPAVKVDKLENGRIRLSRLKIKEVDLREILEAVRGAQDGEYVTVESTRENVRVAKKEGYLLVEVRERKKDETEYSEKVDVKMPLSVVDALLSAGEDELDLVAALRTLRAHGDAELITVKDRHETVRIWVDSKNTSE